MGALNIIRAQIWLFDISHKRIAIRFYFNENDKIAYIIMVNCEYIQGFFSVDNPTFSISQFLNNVSLENMYKIIDENNNFELISRGIVFVKGKESEFGDNFDEFLMDKVNFK
ncbi:hypothetical protein [Chryseobacterium jejuense]|uniref:hypothetical protein n=1 Tax=Chryseobacterium jejuense TaxID=445960 RepID=UPI001AE1FEC3|nr:hypothetical protein [Chryseobacterium jejuense]MBP2616381.1 hypothetical protein [Chryseobacterium jejuense]